MCLGIPGKITEFFDLQGTAMAKVDFGGVFQDVCVSAVPEARLGQYVIVHAGFALNTLSDTEAEETIKLLNELETFNREREADGSGQ